MVKNWLKHSTLRYTFLDKHLALLCSFLTFSSYYLFVALFQLWFRLGFLLNELLNLKVHYVSQSHQFSFSNGALLLQGVQYVIYWKDVFSKYAACHFRHALFSVIQR